MSDNQLFPAKALSVRQPWAWAILHAGKDVENRSAAALRHMRIEPFSSIALHASKGMTRDEYEEAAEFMATLGVVCPAPNLLLRGGMTREPGCDARQTANPRRARSPRARRSRADVQKPALLRGRHAPGARRIKRVARVQDSARETLFRPKTTTCQRVASAQRGL